MSVQCLCSGKRRHLNCTAEKCLFYGKRRHVNCTPEKCLCSGKWRHVNCTAEKAYNLHYLLLKQSFCLTFQTLLQRSNASPSNTFEQSSQHRTVQGPLFQSRVRKDITFCCTGSTPALRPTQPPTRRVQEALSSGDTATRTSIWPHTSIYPNGKMSGALSPLTRFPSRRPEEKFHFT